MRPSRLRRPLQIAGFVRKETLDVIRQPRLLLVLVLGPFLILVAFGLGYQAETKPYRTLFVAPPGSPLLDRVEGYADQLGTYVRFEGTSTDEPDARRRLEKGDLDVVVIFPPDPADIVLSGKQATITVLHNRLDPIELTAIDFASRLAVDQINSEILASIVTEGQKAIRPAKEEFAAGAAGLQALDRAVAAGDFQGAGNALAELRSHLDSVDLGLRSTQELLLQFDQQDADGVLGGNTTQLRQILDQLNEQIRRLESDLAGGVIGPTTADDVHQMATLMDQASQQFDRFTSIEATTLVRPFTSQVETATPGTRTITDFYAPAAVVLLVQQFGIVFAALTFVRERQLGILELFRAAPLDAPEAVTGKYLSYLILGGAVAAALTTMVVFALDVPMAGSWSDVAVALGLTLFASIGLGLVISLVSATDTQAVQYTMIVLLASLFFSGFFLSVEQLSYPARLLSWLLPGAYGMRLLRDVMLRGEGLDPVVTVSLGAYGAVALMLAIAGARRRLGAVR